MCQIACKNDDFMVPLKSISEIVCLLVELVSWRACICSIHIWNFIYERDGITCFLVGVQSAGFYCGYKTFIDKLTDLNFLQFVNA